MRDTIMTVIDDALKDNDLDTLYSYLDSFFREFYPDDVAQHHYKYALDAISYLETKSILDSSEPHS